MTESGLSMHRTLIIAVHDIFVVTAALPVALLLREQRWPDAERLATLVAAMPLLVAAAVVAAVVVAPHRALWRRLGGREIVTLAQFTALALMIFYLGQFLVDRLDALPRSAPVLQFMTAMCGLIATRLAYETTRRASAPQAGDGPDAAPVLLVGAGDGAALMVELLRQHPGHGEPVGILCDDVQPARCLAGVPILGGLDRIDAVLARLRVQGMAPARLVVTRPHHELGRAAVHDLVARASTAGLRVEQLPDLLRLMGAPDGTPADAAERRPAAAPADARKRVLDVAVAAAALVVLSPVLGLAGLAVALGVQRPVLFVQVRPGRHRRPYKLVKFRTMRDPTDAAGRTLSDAERTPWVGRLLRRLRLDELPQFWNVVRGDMALIGPRPLLASDLDAMGDGGRARSAVRPGVTGWAQVNGGHQLTGEEKLALDLWYAAHADLALDLRILWLTVVMMVRGERRVPTAIARARADAGSEPAAPGLAGAAPAGVQSTVGARSRAGADPLVTAE
jgi:lipopolysaccharide/colanic/teichoic acid biosynthesis glycosyltransferase